MSDRARDVPLAVALAAFFTAVQFYPALAALADTPPVGYLFLNRAGAAGVVAVLVATAGYALARLVLSRGFAAPELRTSLGVLACWIGGLVPASVASMEPADSYQIVGFALVAGCFHLGLVRWYARPPVALSVLVTFLAAGGLAALSSIVMVLAKRPAPLYALNHGRAAGVFVTTNQLGAFLVLDLFLAIGVASATLRPRLRGLALANLAVGLVALGLSFSRGAWLGAAAGGCALAALLGYRRTALGGLGLLGLAVVLVLARPVAGHNPAEAFTRLSTLEGGVRDAALFPLTGSGPMTYFAIFGTIRPSNGGLPGSFEALHPHNVILSLAGETGLIGIAAVAAGWTLFARGVRRRLRAGPVPNARLAAAICAAFVALFVQGMADLVGVVELMFVWIPYAALALAAASHGLAE